MLLHLQQGPQGFSSWYLIIQVIQTHNGELSAHVVFIHWCTSPPCRLLSWRAFISFYHDTSMVHPSRKHHKKKRDELWKIKNLEISFVYIRMDLCEVEFNFIRLAGQIQQIVFEFIVKETVNNEFLILQKIFIARFLNDYEEFKISSLSSVFLN